MTPAPAPKLAPKPPVPDYRLYMDEAGNHCMTGSMSFGQRFLALVGISFRGDAIKDVDLAVQDFTERHFGPSDPDDPIILHRRDIIDRKGPFSVLRDPARDRVFCKDLLRLLTELDYCVIGVVIDKKTHREAKHRRLVHPYHYSMHAMLERYVGLLRYLGKTGDVIAEARGGTEDTELKRVFTGVWEDGTYFLSRADAQKHLSTKQLKLKTKEANVAGLQLADLIAAPVRTLVLDEFDRCEEPPDGFTKEIGAVLEDKFNRRFDTGRVRGYGMVFLP